MLDFLTFKRMITPIIIQVVFWIGVVVVIAGGCITIAGSLAMFGGGSGSNQSTALGAVLGGVALILFGPIVLRIYAEVLMVLFRINDSLTDVSNRLVSIDEKTKTP